MYILNYLSELYPLALFIITVVGFFWKEKLAQRDIENTNYNHSLTIQKMELQINTFNELLNKYKEEYSNYKITVSDKFSEGNMNFVRFEGKIEQLNQKLDMVISLIKNGKEY